MKTWLITLCVIFLFSTHLISGKVCACGDFASGHVNYEVDGEGCCTSKPSADWVGMVRTYIENEGAWEIDAVKVIPSQEAQDRCCVGAT